jgi:hypothetical protein
MSVPAAEDMNSDQSITTLEAITMNLQEARREHGQQIKEAGQIERLEDKRDLHPHEWSRLCSIYRRIKDLEQFMAACHG